MRNLSVIRFPKPRNAAQTLTPYRTLGSDYVNLQCPAEPRPALIPLPVLKALDSLSLDFLLNHGAPRVLDVLQGVASAASDGSFLAAPDTWNDVRAKLADFSADLVSHVSGLSGERFRDTSGAMRRAADGLLARNSAVVPLVSASLSIGRSEVGYQGACLHVAGQVSALLAFLESVFSNACTLRLALMVRAAILSHGLAAVLPEVAAAFQHEVCRHSMPVDCTGIAVLLECDSDFFASFIARLNALK